ncbi:cation:proton antiporter [Frankia sp. AgB1.9]|uniref:cation:proton antiporter domain-containing protein n=1 Tax=Frankia sp. AgB1.9 TaxID=1836968 RepID=UPI001933B43F|nr:cation:proton antiporter [Frankia sp. AgB1.9]MBL7546538.1 cation:proton antiporter [Frankia sp. AgB1.9]
MDPAVAAVAVAIFGYALVERRLWHTPISGAMVFTAAGLLASEQVTGLVNPAEAGHGAMIFLELTLAVVLFSDAMGANVGSWATEAPLPGRLLGLGLPLTMAVGWMLGWALFHDLGPWGAALLAAVLAPTDSALGLPVITDERVPRLIRHALNVEGGLNDGLVLPFVTIFLALAQEEENAAGSGYAVTVLLRALVASAAVGLALGAVGAVALRWSKNSGWSGRRWQSAALLALAVLAYVLADLIDGSGFIAAWVAGLAAGLVARESLSAALRLPEEAANLGVSVSFMLFGALFLAPALESATWTAVAYGLLSLTVIRMVPVALALSRSRLAPQTVAYVGWFGPRGLASIVFAGLVATSGLPEQGQIVPVVMLTVGMSVVLHGITAPSGARRYGRWYAGAVAHSPEIREAAPGAGGGGAGGGGAPPPPPGGRRGARRPVAGVG